MDLKEINKKISKAKKELEKLEAKRLKIFKAAINKIGFKKGDLIVCVENIGSKKVKNIFVYHKITENGGFVANGYTVRASIRNKYYSVLYCAKEVITIEKCCEYRLATEKEKELYNESLEKNRLV